MPIQFGCPNCGAVAQVESEMAGGQVLCPSCSATLIVPPQGLGGSPAGPFSETAPAAGSRSPLPIRVRRKLTSQERARRRLQRILIAAMLGLALVVVAMAIVLNLDK